MMDTEITNVRDEWITQFREQWDSQISQMRTKKDIAICSVDKLYKKELSDIERIRDQQLQMIHDKFNNDVEILKTNNTSQKSKVERQFTQEVKDFVTQSLHEPTIYESVYSYICNTFYNPEHTFTDNKDSHIVNKE